MTIPFHYMTIVHDTFLWLDDNGRHNRWCSNLLGYGRPLINPRCIGGLGYSSLFICLSVGLRYVSIQSIWVGGELPLYT